MAKSRWIGHSMCSKVHSKWCPFRLFRVTKHFISYLSIVWLQVDFATMTREQVDAEMETDIALETESIRTAEKYTSITKDTGNNWFYCGKDLIKDFFELWTLFIGFIHEFRILRLTFHRKSASKSWIRQIILAFLNYFQMVQTNYLNLILLK